MYIPSRLHSQRFAPSLSGDDDRRRLVGGGRHMTSTRIRKLGRQAISEYLPSLCMVEKGEEAGHCRYVRRGRGFPLRLSRRRAV